MSLALGAGLGLVAGAAAVGAGVAAFRARGIELLIDGSDYVLLIVGARRRPRSGRRSAWA